MDPQGAAPLRLTPNHFSRPHTVARFTAAGQLVTVTPGVLDGASTVAILDVKALLAGNRDVRRELQLLEDFPGPLARWVMHGSLFTRRVMLESLGHVGHAGVNWPGGPCWGHWLGGSCRGHLTRWSCRGHLDQIGHTGGT